jgi:hypothetical protein
MRCPTHGRPEETAGSPAKPSQRMRSAEGLSRGSWRDREFGLFDGPPKTPEVAVRGTSGNTFLPGSRVAQVEEMLSIC